MPTAKIRPVFTAECSDKQHRCEPLRLTDKWEDDYGSGDRYNSDYWDARRAFLNSYRLSGKNDGFKNKMKRSFREVGDAALEVMVEFKDKAKISWKEVKGAAINVTVGLWRAVRKRRTPGGGGNLRPSRLLGGFDCFVPWWIKMQLRATGAVYY